MYVIVLHDIKNPATAFPRGDRLKIGEGAPSGVRVLQFYPSSDSSRVTCLWEADSAAEVQQYVDGTLGDASVNLCYEVLAEQAFAERPLGLPSAPVLAR